MSIDKKIDYVAQDGVKNYVKNSPSVRVPKKFKARKDAPAVKLAYITDAEAKMLKKKNKGTPHKGPRGIPSYDSFDADGNFTSGAAMSAAESGKNTSDTLAAGMTGKDVQDIRSSVIAAGAGQRVNPGFFDSPNTVSPDMLARAKAFAPAAFKKTRGGGLGSFISGGGFLGNIVRGIGQKFGLGKRYNEPTYDMSRFNPTVNPKFQNDLDNELMLSPELDEFDANTFDDNVSLNNIASLINNVPDSTYDMAPQKFVSPEGIMGIDVGQDDIAFQNDLMAEVKPNTLKQLQNMGIYKEGQKSPYTDKDELKMLVPGLNKATDEELDQIIAGTFKV